MKALLTRPAITATLGTAVFAAVVAWQIANRTALSMDELHTALIARAAASGDPLSFYVGSVSRYEGGSWLIGFPVAALMKVGAWPTAAASWTAAAISIATVWLSSLWLAREVKPSAGLGPGPLAALAAPELVHYSYRAWGSLCEALLFLPLLALAYGHWIDRGRNPRTAPLLGVLLGVAIVFSYLHMLTALVFVAIHLHEGAERPWRRRVGEIAAVGGTTCAVFGIWLVGAVPYLYEALRIRDGASLGSVATESIRFRPDRVFLHLPHAWMGSVPEPTTAGLAAGVALSLLAAGAGVVVWRRGGRARWAVVFLLATLPAVSVGHTLATVPMALRYYLPLLAAAVLVISAWDLRAVAAGMVIGLAFWIPHGLEMPGHWPQRSYAELGANALHRYLPDPHLKFRVFRRHTPPELRRSLAFGYGLDSGSRFGGEWGSLQDVADPDPERQPQLYLRDARTWIAAYEEPAAPDRNAFLTGFGVGLARDGRLDGAEGRLLGLVSAEDRAVLLEGVGARLRDEEGEWDPAVSSTLTSGDRESLARGGVRAKTEPSLKYVLSLPILVTPLGDG